MNDPQYLELEQLSVFFALKAKHIGKNKNKKNVDIFVDFLCDSISALFKSLIFPISLKLADVTPIHKNGMKELKEDYRSVSILPTLSKMIERILFVQISASFDNVF